MINKEILFSLVNETIKKKEEETKTLLSKDEKSFILREHLQIFLLEALYLSPDFNNVFFMGGTNLRICYGLPRYSEDMDFTILNGTTAPDNEKITEIMKETFPGIKIEGLEWGMKYNIMKTHMKFPGLMYECGIKGSIPDEKLTIKFEMDTMPSEGQNSESRTVFFGDNMFIRINHHTIETTFAGKLSAVLMRKYAKGRDLFDLEWYLRRKPTAKFSLEYVNGNIRRYNSINENEEGFESVKEFSSHKDVLDAIVDRIEKYTENNKIRINDDIRKMIFWPNQKIETYMQDLYPRIKELLYDYNGKINIEGGGPGSGETDI